MRNKDGKYVATRYMNQTGTHLTGVGDTPEQAKTYLKNELKKYREAMRLGIYLVPTGEKIRSPGCSLLETPSGSVKLTYDQHREIDVMARPDLAKYIQGGCQGNYVKETRQIRRSRERRGV